MTTTRNRRRAIIAAMILATLGLTITVLSVADRIRPQAWGTETVEGGDQTVETGNLARERIHTAPGSTISPPSSDHTTIDDTLASMEASMDRTEANLDRALDGPGTPVANPAFMPKGHAAINHRAPIDVEWVLIASDTMTALQGVEITFAAPGIPTEVVTSDAAGRVSVPEAYRAIIKYEGQSGEGCWTSTRKVHKSLSVRTDLYPDFDEHGYQVGTDGVRRRSFLVLPD